MQHRFELTPEDLAAFAAFKVGPRSPMRALLLRVRILMALILLCISALFFLEHIEWIAWTFGALSLVTFLGAPWLWRVSQSRATTRRMQQSGGLGERELLIDDDGIEVSDDKERFRARWTAVRDVTDDPSHLFITVRSGTYIIPKRGLEDGGSELLRELRTRLAQRAGG